MTQAEISTNASTEIPVFNDPEIVAPPDPEKIDSIPLATEHIKKAKDSSPAPIANMTQDLFDSITDKSPVVSSSKSTDISLPPEIVDIEVVDDNPKSPEIIESVSDELEISPDLPVKDEPKTGNEASFQQISYPPRYQTRDQQELRLREKAIKLGEDPDKFVTITEKDKLDSIAFRDRMQTDARMCGVAGY